MPSSPTCPATTSTTTTALFSKDKRIWIFPISQPATSLRIGTSCGPGSQWSPSNRFLVRANRSASSWFSSPSICTPMNVVLATAGHELEVRAMLKVNRGGRAESEATEVAVKPYGTPL
ncbi:hypothetical protein AHiyo6_15610 [Arthrobacter sp. Hiyo6]|nr:hypothetical protein AHiyo6_15610 [Arthrobacter sp. Hiyo6]